MSLSLFVGKSIFFVESTIYLKNRRYSAGIVDILKNRRYNFIYRINRSFKRAIQKNCSFVLISCEYWKRYVNFSLGREKGVIFMNEMIHKMEQHVSVRKYKEESIPKDVVERMVQAAQHAASSHFVQAYSVIYVTDQDLKAKLAELSGNRHVKDCAAFFVCCADLKRLEMACENMVQR